MANELRNLDVQFVSLVDRAAVRDPSNPTEPQRLLLWKAERGATPQTQEDNVSTDDLSAALEKAEAERDELAAKVAELEKAEADRVAKKEAKKAVSKADLAPEVRELLEKAESERDELRKAADEAAALAKAERDLRITKEFIAKAEADFPNVGGDSKEFGPVLKALTENLSEDVFKAVETRLRAAEEQVRVSNLFKEAGVGGDPAPSSGDGLADEAVRRAAEVQKADPSVSTYDALRNSMTREQQAAYLASVR